MIASRRVMMTAAAVALLVAAMGATAHATPNLPPSMTARELSVFMVEQAIEIADPSSDTIATAAKGTCPLTPAAAVEIARAETGRIGADDPVRVYRADAHPIVSLPLRPVFVILFVGGEAPQGGPSGARRVAVEVTGVIVDACSGEFLSMFMHGAN